MIEWKIHQERDEDDPEIRCYTLTLRKGFEGWNTDSGYHGYGLPKELAQWICDTLNKSNESCPYEMNAYGTWRKSGSEEDE